MVSLSLSFSLHGARAVVRGCPRPVERERRLPVVMGGGVEAVLLREVVGGECARRAVFVDRFQCMRMHTHTSTSTHSAHVTVEKPYS